MRRPAPTAGSLGRALALALAPLAACGDAAPVDPAAALLGGDTTIFDDGDEAFNYPLRNLPAELRGPFQIGDGIFNRNWVAAPATPQGQDGLGPTYNALSCSACHANNGRGAPPAADGEPFLGLLLRLSVPGAGAHGEPLPEPTYGDQLQPYAILGVPAEGTPAVSYVERTGAYADGEPFALRAPAYAIGALGFGAMAADVQISPRVAPQLVGLGLLEAVAEDTILALADGNGGHANRVWDVARQESVLGRFGWKANQPGLAQQTLGAFRNDIGITSALLPTENCPQAQQACAGAPPSMSQPNLSALRTNAITVHSLALAIPARRRLDDGHARRGEVLFARLGCALCHVPTLQTGVLEGWPALSGQTIHPFTDLLLHDMGPDLGDGRPDFLATGSEWRTPPLWGLGLVETINDHTLLLHDGRARGFAEAILWHGGQGEAARESFRAARKQDRDDLVAFLRSL